MQGHENVDTESTRVVKVEGNAAVLEVRAEHERQQTDGSRAKWSVLQLVSGKRVGRLAHTLPSGTRKRDVPCSGRQRGKLELIV